MKLNDNVEVSLGKGLVFHFYDGDNTFIYRCSSGGKEAIEANGKVIFESYNFKLCSEHTFAFNGFDYTIRIAVKNLLKGDIECSFSKGIENKKTYELKYDRSKPFWKRNFLAIAIGCIIGFGSTTDLIPKWAVYPIVVIGFFVIMQKSARNWTCEVVDASMPINIG